MDLNQLAPPAPAEPARAPLRVVRLQRDRGTTSEDGLAVFDGGEALPDSVGEDFPMPISAEERQALLDAGYSPEDVDLIEQVSGAEAEDDLPLRTGPNAMEQAMADLLERTEIAAAKQARVLYDEQQAEQAHLEATYYSRHCPLPTCDAIARVPKGSDHGDVLGLGMSMEAAAKLEGVLLGHLSSHSFGDWIAALKAQQETIDSMLTQAYATPAAGIVRQESLVAAPLDGMIPGPAQRSPEKQAAVDALDRRLGRGAPAPMSPQDTAARDNALREARARRRAAPPPDPYTLTPKWSSEQGDGTVGIKR